MLIENSISAFSFSSSTWTEDWKRLQSNCGLLSDWGAATLAEGLEGCLKSVVVEPKYICKDHRNLFSNYYSKKFNVESAYTSRLHFFSKTVDDIQKFLAGPDKYAQDYIGYSVIRPVKQRCLGRTIIDPLKLKNTNKPDLYCLRTKFVAHIAGRPFEICGYPYTSQDADVTVCAHTALWGVCRFLSEKYPVYREMYPFDLIKSTESNQGRTFPLRGMTYTDYSKILTDFGTFPIIFRVKQSPTSPVIDSEAFSDLCTYVESGFPVLASHPGHVVALIGHTIDYDQPSKAAVNGFIDSSSFLKEFVVIDDNFFPYQILGNSTNTNNYGSRYHTKTYSIESIYTGVAPIPEKVFLLAKDARKTAMEHFIRNKARLKQIGNEPFVVRLFLATSSSYKKRKLEKSKISGNLDNISFFVPELLLPHFIWVAEASPIDMYKKGLCTAEIVMDATCSQLEDAILYMRIGNSITFGNSGQQTISGNPTYFSQFTHNLGER
jgi:hypothetical protein